MHKLLAVVLCGLAVIAVPHSVTIAGASPCKTVDGLSKETVARAKSFEDATGLKSNTDWLKRVRSCTVGRYVVSGPADGSSNNLIVTKDGIFVTIIEPNQTLLFEGHDRLVTALSDQDADGRFDSIDYRGRDKQTGKDVWVYDTDFDGRTDMLIVDEPDGTSKHLFQIEGVWLERVSQDGQLGFMIDGKFVRTREEAAALLRKRHD